MGNALRETKRKMVWLALIAVTAWGLSAGRAVFADNVIYDDLIVTGSECIGFDCANGESFGYSTIKVKENNLQIEFCDTSVGSFPTNDWKIQTNDTTSGGASYFTIWDVDGGRRPFTIEAGAPAHSLYVEDYGRVGLGTSIPSVELHIVDGDTPTIRLDQDSSSGWTPQKWDLAGNETNFFIRDVTTGSKLPFRIRPGARTSSIDIAASGNVGIGTASPDNTLHVFKASAGGVTGGVNSPLVVENDTFCFINLLSPSTHGVGVAFGDAEAIDSGLIQYSHPEDSMRFNTNGAERVRITSTGNLIVTGTISSGGTTLNVPDYVFEPDYQLMPISELDRFVRQEKHLPRIPSAADVKTTGSVNMTEMQMRLLEKVEELTLYTIEQHKTIEDLEQRLGRIEGAPHD